MLSKNTCIDSKIEIFSENDKNCDFLYVVGFIMFTVISIGYFANGKKKIISKKFHLLDLVIFLTCHSQNYAVRKYLERKSARRYNLSNVSGLQNV